MIDFSSLPRRNKTYRDSRHMGNDEYSRRREVEDAEQKAESIERNGFRFFLNLQVDSGAQRCFPRKNRAIVPGPECDPITGPIYSIISTALPPDASLTIS